MDSIASQRDKIFHLVFEPTADGVVVVMV